MSMRNRKATCLYCSKVLLKRCLKLHTTRFHPNEVVAEKFDAAPITNWFRTNQTMELDNERTSVIENFVNTEEGNIGTSDVVSQIWEDQQGLLRREIEQLKAQIEKLNDLLTKKCDQLEQFRMKSNQTAPLISSIEIQQWLDDKTENLCHIENNFTIVCSLCHNSNKNSAGILTFNFEIGPAMKIDTVSFTSLKGRVTKHLSSIRHQVAIKNKSKKDKTNIVGAAKKLARTAYYINMSSSPQTAYPDLVLLQHLNQSFMGDLNHSEQVVAKFRDWFSEALRDKIKVFVQESTCISIVADKVTIARKTLDVMAVIGIMPDCMETQLFQCLVIGAPEVVMQDNETMAHSWKQTLEESGITSCSQIASISTDGAYHHGKQNIPKQFSRMLENSEIDVPTIWDQAHLLELALADVAKAPWIKAITTLVPALNGRYASGKSYGELEEMAIKTGRSFRKPIGFCDTRFTAHCRKAYQVFFHNLELYRIQIARDLKRKKFKNKEIVSYFTDNKEKIESDTALLIDIYEPVSRCSLSFQSLQKLPWEKMDDFHSMLEELQKMKDSVTSPLYISNTWPVFQSLGYPMSEEQVANTLVLIRDIRESCLRRIRGVDAHLNRRQTANNDIFDAIDHIKLLGDITSLKEDISEDFPKRFQLSLKIIQDRGLVPLTVSIVQDVFQETRRILRLHPDSKARTRTLFKYLWDDHQDNIFVRSYLNLITRLWLLLPSESIVESLGSSLNHIFGDSRNLKHKNAVKELIIRSNGPPLNEADAFIDSVCKARKFKAVRERSNPLLREGVVITRLKKRGFPLKKYF